MRLRRAGEAGAATEENSYLEIDPRELTGIFAAPQWLRDMGFASWLIVGVAAAVVGLVWLLAITHTIVIPVITGAIIAAVAAPMVDFLAAHRVPRAAGAGLTLLLIVALGALVGYIVLDGIVSEGSSITAQLTSAVDKAKDAVSDLGASPDSAQQAATGASDSISKAFHALTRGLAAGLGSLASLAVFLSFTILAMFFLLKDGPSIRDFAERHLGVPQPVARTILGRTAGSLRGYFAGMMIVSGFSSVIVLIGAVAIDAPVPATIAAATFVGGFVPYLGAWTAGAFAVLVTLGGNGPADAAIMAVICLLANGALQQMVQPIAYGATLGLHPLAVLIVTIAGGALFGTIGLVLAAPLLSSAVKITADLEKAREKVEAEAAQPDAEPGPEPDPAPA